MAGLIGFLALGLAIALGLAVWLVVWRLRHPPRRTYAWAVAKGMPGDPSELDAPREFVATELGVGDGIRCAAWDIRGDLPTGPAIIATPGWGDSRIGVLVRIDALCAASSRVIAWDPPGTGETPGLCPMGTREPEMILAIARWVRSEERAPGAIAYGWSLGGGASVVAAGMDDEGLIDSVIAEAPYRVPWTPAFRVMRGAALPWRVNGPIAMALLGLRLGMGPMWKRRGGFDRALWAAKVRVSVTVIHGTSDAICPIEDGRDIAAGAGARGRMVEIPSGGHNDLWTDARWSAEVGRSVAETIRTTPIGPEMGIPPARG